MYMYPFKLQELNYDYDELKPFISKETMTLHHKKHQKSYIDKLNDYVSCDNFLKELPLDQMISFENLKKLDKDKEEKIRNFGGGHYNHLIYFNAISPNPKKPGKLLSNLVKKDFLSFKKMEDLFKEKAQSYFGSGWCWLVLKNNELKIQTTSNQDNPINDCKCTCLMGIDLWEHSYYLDYNNRKKDYLNQIWEIVNWIDIDNKILESENVK